MAFSASAESNKREIEDEDAFDSNAEIVEEEKARLFSVRVQCKTGRRGVVALQHAAGDVVGSRRLFVMRSSLSPSLMMQEFG